MLWDSATWLHPARGEAGGEVPLSAFLRILLEVVLVYFKRETGLQLTITLFMLELGNARHNELITIVRIFAEGSFCRKAINDGRR